MRQSGLCPHATKPLFLHLGDLLRDVTKCSSAHEARHGHEALAGVKLTTLARVAALHRFTREAEDPHPVAAGRDFAISVPKLMGDLEMLLAIFAILVEIDSGE